MLKINTKEDLKSFKGDVLKNGENNLSIGEALAVVLSGKTSNPTLAWILGKKFACDDEVELKAEEVVFLKKELKDNNNWTSLVLGQILEILGEKE